MLSNAFGQIVNGLYHASVMWNMMTIKKKRKKGHWHHDTLDLCLPASIPKGVIGKTTKILYCSFSNWKSKATSWSTLGCPCSVSAVSFSTFDICLRQTVLYVCIQKKRWIKLLSSESVSAYSVPTASINFMISLIRFMFMLIDNEYLLSYLQKAGCNSV